MCRIPRFKQEASNRRTSSHGDDRHADIPGTGTLASIVEAISECMTQTVVLHVFIAPKGFILNNSLDPYKTVR
jgi:hypothetical protein